MQDNALQGALNGALLYALLWQPDGALLDLRWVVKVVNITSIPEPLPWYRYKTLLPCLLQSKDFGINSPNVGPLCITSIASRVKLRHACSPTLSPCHRLSAFSLHHTPTPPSLFGANSSPGLLGSLVKRDSHPRESALTIFDSPLEQGWDDQGSGFITQFSFFFTDQGCLLSCEVTSLLMMSPLLYRWELLPGTLWLKKKTTMHF